jgi:hypothetical protein
MTRQLKIITPECLSPDSDFQKTFMSKKLVIRKFLTNLQQDKVKPELWPELLFKYLFEQGI